MARIDDGGGGITYQPTKQPKVKYEGPKVVSNQPYSALSTGTRFNSPYVSRLTTIGPVRYTPPQGSTFNTKGSPGTQDYSGEGYNQWVAQQEAMAAERALADQQAQQQEREWHMRQLQEDYARKAAAQHWQDAKNKKGDKKWDYQSMYNDLHSDYRFDKRVDQLRKLYELNSKKWGNQSDPEATSEKFFLRESSNAYSDQGDDGGGYDYYPYYGGYGGYGGGGGGYSYTPQPAKMPAWFMNLLNWDI